MKDGFIKVCAATPDIAVADCNYNVDKIRDIIKEQEENGVKLIVFPELAITGYTCQDLFLQDILLTEARAGLKRLVEESKEMEILVFVGLPFSFRGKLYNVTAAFQKGHLLGIVPKKYMPNYAEFYELRHFYAGDDKVQWIVLPEFGEEKIPFGRNLLFQCKEIAEFCIAAELCEDLWAAIPPSSFHAVYGATVIVNLSASDDNIGKEVYRKELIKNQSARLICGYIYASAGEGESTQDLVFGGHSMICENGSLLIESKRFQNGCIVTELDVKRLISDRRRMNTFYINETESEQKRDYVTVSFSFSIKDTILTRKFPQKPFVPSVKEEREKRCEEILTIQALGLKKRIKHTHCQSVVIGISGGLDSTLTLLVAVKAFDMLGMDRKHIFSITMPCFGTTDRTYHNAVELAKQLNTTLLEIPIKEAVNQHFKDIGHDPNVHDITYENSQARERTMILMNIANKYSGMVVGTGDMSELALGWATYNGDHMSMYNVNGSVPKTLVRYLVLYYAQTSKDPKVQEILLDVLDTPVSPELLPPKDGEIAQKTEDLVGPYELHDFYLYYCLRFGMMPSKIYRLAWKAFENIYDKETIYKWLRTFYYRFFSQQFKRSCLPDGPKVGSVCVSPRGDLRMPSDAVWEIWRKDLEQWKDK